MNIADRLLVRQAHALTIDWTIHLTRELPGPIAHDRFAQITSDLWEQEHASRLPAPLLAASLVRRLVLGVPADLSWRRQVLDQHPRTPTDGAAMTHRKRRTPAGKPWVPLTADSDSRFDQTNGVVDVTGDHRPDPGPSEIEQALWRTGQANIGMGR